MKNMKDNEIKSCCVNFYENDLVSKFFGENFHPGGEKLTIILGEKLGLNEESRVLDIACGPGKSAIILAKRFGCQITGIDLSEKNIDKARENVTSAGLSKLINFEISDAEKIKFENLTFDAIICECALCTFPNKKIAINEMFRVLKKGGKVGITDVIIENDLPDNLKVILFHVACISGALSIKGYQDLLKKGGFNNIQYENQNWTLNELIKKAEKMLKGYEIIKKICDCNLEKSFGMSEIEVKNFLKTGFDWLEKGGFGYGLFIGTKK